MRVAFWNHFDREWTSEWDQRQVLTVKMEKNFSSKRSARGREDEPWCSQRFRAALQFVTLHLLAGSY